MVIVNLAISVYVAIRTGQWLVANGQCMHCSPVGGILISSVLSILIGALVFCVIYLCEAGIALVFSEGKKFIKEIWNPDECDQEY